MTPCFRYSHYHNGNPYNNYNGGGGGQTGVTSEHEWGQAAMRAVMRAYVLTGG